MYISISIFICFYLTSPHQHPSDVYPQCKVNCWVPSPAEGFPLCKQSLLCVWNRRCQHSSAQASNKDPNSYRNNPDSHWEGKPIRFYLVAASLKVDNQCLCEAKLMPTGWVQSRSNRQPSVLLPELCRWSTSLWKHWIILDKDHDHQCWIISATYVFYWWIMDVQNLHFQIGFNGLDKPSLAAWDSLATTRTLHQQRGRPQLFLFSDSDIVQAAHLGDTGLHFQTAAWSKIVGNKRGGWHFLNDHSMIQKICLRGFKLSRKIRIKMSQCYSKCFPIHSELLSKQGTPKPGLRPDLAPKSKLKTCYSPTNHPPVLVSFSLPTHSHCLSQLGLALQRGIDWTRDRKKTFLRFFFNLVSSISHCTTGKWVKKCFNSSPGAGAVSESVRELGRIQC